MTRVCFVIASTLALLAPVGATERAWLTIGMGSDSCGKFVRAIDAMVPMPSGTVQSLNWQNKTFFEEGYAYREYLFGFVSGTNLSRPDASNQISADNDGIVMWVRHYCESHADESINTAISAFVQEQRTKMK
jgi:hypothetical protein